MSQSRLDGLFLVDYHAHILPGCDHGSDGTETSKRQLEAAKAAGIETVCATSHFYPDKENLDRFLARRTDCFEKLKAVRGNFPEIRLGAEVLLCEGFEHFENIEKLQDDNRTLNDELEASKTLTRELESDLIEAKDELNMADNKIEELQAEAEEREKTLLEK